VLNFADRKLFAFQMLQALQPVLGLSDEENERAVEAGFKALQEYETGIRRRARQVLDQLEREDRIGIVMLGRPYHHDPGLNHEIFSFKCGHDAPIYGVIEGIIEQSGTPYFCFKDLDENKPTGSIRIRVETIDYFLRRYREEVIRKRKAAEYIEAQQAALEAELRRERGPSSEVEGESEAPVFANTEATREIQEMAAD